jgi:hypothetical protein
MILDTPSYPTFVFPTLTKTGVQATPTVAVATPPTTAPLAAVVPSTTTLSTSTTAPSNSAVTNTNTTTAVPTGNLEEAVKSMSAAQQQLMKELRDMKERELASRQQIESFLAQQAQQPNIQVPQHSSLPSPPLPLDGCSNRFMFF